MSMGDTSKPTVMFTCCLHGSEKNATELGMEFATRWATSSEPEFVWLRTNLRCVLMPCCSPYGFDGAHFNNPNGVNLNRNFDFLRGDGTSAWEAWVNSPNNNKGDAPFSELETQHVRTVFEAEDPILAVDIHTNIGVMGMDVGKVYTEYRTLLQGVYNTTHALMPDDAFLEYSVGTSPTATGYYGKGISKEGMNTCPSILEPDATPANIEDGMSFGLTALYLMARKAYLYLISQ